MGGRADSRAAHGVEIPETIRQGNFKAAYDGFRRLASDPAGDPKSIGEDLNKAADALQQLGRLEELDDLRDKVIRIHDQNWRLLWAAADNYFQSSHDGTLVAGKFIRADQKSGGRAVNALERDRVRALQLMVAAMKLIPPQPPRRMARPRPNATELKPNHRCCGKRQPNMRSRSRRSWRTSFSIWPACSRPPQDLTEDSRVRFRRRMATAMEIGDFKH